MLRSIRWRLAASYTLLTLLIVILVGAATLWLVRVSVERQETTYLTANANSVARQVLALWDAPSGADGAPHPMLMQLARTAAFLGNVQVKILDAQRNVLVDSGDPFSLNELAWFFAPAPDGATFAFSTALSEQMDWTQRLLPPPDFADLPLQAQLRLRAAMGQFPPRDAHEVIAAAAPLTSHITGADVVIIRTFPSQWGSRIEFEAEQTLLDTVSAELSQGSASLEAERVAPITRSVALQQSSGQPAAQAAQASAALTEIPRSLRRVEVSIGSPAEPLGYVALSNGPDYGSPLLDTILKAFGIAAGGVSLLAVLIGLVVGQGLTAPLLKLTAAAEQMSRGELTSRAHVQSRDEIGALARQFNQMAAQLEDSFGELAAERDALRRFIADASHELRTPITALQTFLDLLGSSAANDPQAQREFVQASQQQVDRLGRVTASLLALSRLDGGVSDLRLQPENAVELMQRTASLFRVAAQERHIDFSICLPEPTLAVLCDCERIESALTNLLDNAFKFTPQGGCVEMGAASSEGRHVRFWVQDTGPGVAPADAPHIFERFYQGQVPAPVEEPDKVHPVERGAGLGLSIVQSIVRAHGGAVRHETPQEGGSRFTIELPNYI